VESLKEASVQIVHEQIVDGRRQAVVGQDFNAMSC
jgi:hypothetical protein